MPIIIKGKSEAREGVMRAMMGDEFMLPSEMEEQTEKLKKELEESEKKLAEKDLIINQLKSQLAQQHA